MKIHGLQKLTLLDFPGRTACTVFTARCQLRCPFCHNAALAFGDAGPALDEAEFFRFLAKRQGLLEGVCVTGGEPLLQAGLSDFLSRVREMGYLVKLDTNGFLPDRLSALIEQGLVDYVAMDIKSSPQGYAKACGLDAVDMQPVRESIALLMGGGVDYEFRTTVVRGIHEESDMAEAAKLIEGAERYFLQQYVDPGDQGGSGLSAFSAQEMQRFAAVAKPYVKNIGIRGV